MVSTYVEAFVISPLDKVYSEEEKKKLKKKDGEDEEKDDDEDDWRYDEDDS